MRTRFTEQEKRGQLAAWGINDIAQLNFLNLPRHLSDEVIGFMVMTSKPYAQSVLRVLSRRSVAVDPELVRGREEPKTQPSNPLWSIFRAVVFKLGECEAYLEPGYFDPEVAFGYAHDVINIDEEGYAWGKPVMDGSVPMTDGIPNYIWEFYTKPFTARWLIGIGLQEFKRNRKDVQSSDKWIAAGEPKIAVISIKAKCPALSQREISDNFSKDSSAGIRLIEVAGMKGVRSFEASNRVLVPDVIAPPLGSKVSKTHISYEDAYDLIVNKTVSPGFLVELHESQISAPISLSDGLQIQMVAIGNLNQLSMPADVGV